MFESESELLSELEGSFGFLANFGPDFGTLDFVLLTFGGSTSSESVSEEELGKVVFDLAGTLMGFATFFADIFDFKLPSFEEFIVFESLSLVDSELELSFFGSS